MQVKIAKNVSVNPRNVVFSILDSKSLKTIIVTLAGKYASDYNFEDTDKLLNGERIISK